MSNETTLTFQPPRPGPRPTPQAPKPARQAQTTQHPPIKNPARRRPGGVFQISSDNYCPNFSLALRR